MENFTASVHFDKRLATYDIAQSIAHAGMLARQGIITEKEAKEIIDGLRSIQKEIDKGNFSWRKELEDVHMNIEKALAERIGEVGKKLHTARSRNDQVATDVRLYVLDATERIQDLLERLQDAFLQQAKTYTDLIIPGYTHLQRAQPVLWSHHMLAYFEMFKRDRERLWDSRKRVDISPLGSCALAGTGFPIDREFAAKELGFSKISSNSMDSVGDRDFIVEFLCALSLIQMHLSRLSEELIIWSSTEFSFIKLPDAFCTGSSIMPQKKNPDVPELIRGKTGRVYGHLVSMLVILKGLPLTYNRDLQEDKEALFDATDTVTFCIEVMAEIVRRTEPHKENIAKSLGKGLLTATDLADYLVKKGLPFRTAHSVVGNIVATCVESGRELSEMPLEELKTFSSLIEEDVQSYLTIPGSVNSKTSFGGTSGTQVLYAITQAERWLKEKMSS